MKKICLSVALMAVVFSQQTIAQTQPLSQQMAATVMRIWHDSFSVKPGNRASWSYDMGVILKGMEDIWQNTGDVKYFNYIQQQMDFFVNDDGTIRGYNPNNYNLDDVNNGKQLMLLYRVLGKEKYRKAAQLLRDQLKTQSRTTEGGFLHNKEYPHQVWLGSLYMGQPFYAEYAMVFKEDTVFNDIAKQFTYVERHARDPKTGLLYHGWDESKQQANKKAGNSPNFLGSALGWYGMALVDVLDYFPKQHAGRDSIIAILNRFAQAIVKVQDPASGLWFNIVDKPKEPKNYKEASASCMLTYTLAKAVRLGYIPASYLANAKKGYTGILKEFIKKENGQVNLHGTVAGSGPVSNASQNESFDPDMRQPVSVNDPVGIGAFLNCAVEMEMIPNLSAGNGKTVVVDRYFNSEKRKDPSGGMDYWHYTWEERTHPGFYTFGSIFKKFGARLASLDVAPTTQNLKGAGVYIIVDPDHIKDNPTPNYVNDNDVKAIAEWVKNGGALLLMANDSNNCDLAHFNKLANAFGFTFTDKSVNMVKNDHFPTGSVLPGANNPVFKTAKNMFLKEVSTITVKSPAKANAVKDGDIIIATAKYGKGVVLAVGDPWLYNEYIDGRKLPAEYDNYAAGEDIAKWLLQSKK
ncbi:MAG: glucuronyl hydrolase [Citrobacter freundii]|nr:MAG: glucuronyl hydrolase [Citrobacter freundii]